MKEYVEINRQTYNELAEEYRARLSGDSEKDRKILSPVVDYLNSNFTTPIRVLDIGSSNGLNLAIMTENGFVGVGVEVAERMLEIARDVCPSAILIWDDFLEAQLYSGSFECVLAKASLHLFPREDALKVLRKSHDLLVPKGLLFIATTLSDYAYEGYYSKPGYKNQARRFRKFWTRDELVSDVEHVGFFLVKESYNFENDWNKKWINLFAVKR